MAHFEIQKVKNAEEIKTRFIVGLKLVVCGYREDATILDFCNAKRYFLQTVLFKHQIKKYNVPSSYSNWNITTQNQPLLSFSLSDQFPD